MAVFDPAGETAAFLKRVGQPFTASPIARQPFPPAPRCSWSDATPSRPNDSTSTRLAVLASEGRAVIVLDQTHPLKYQAIPAEMDLAPRTKKNDFGTEVPTAEGRTAFIEDTSHPAFAG